MHVDYSFDSLAFIASINKRAIEPFCYDSTWLHSQSVKREASIQ